MRIAYLPMLACLCCLVLASPNCEAQSSAQSSADASEQTIKSQKTNKKARKKKSKEQPAQARTYASFRDASSAGYELKNAGKLEESRDAYEAALKFESTDRQKCDAYRSLVSIYPELGQWDAMFEATEHIVENAPYPAFSSLTVRSMTSIVYRKKQQDLLFARYEAKLEKSPKDRTTLVILERAVQQFKFDMPRRAEYLQRLIDLDIEEKKPLDSELRAQLAFVLRLSHKEVESAKLYEAIAESDKDCRAFCLAEAAESWQRADKPKKAIAAAKEASKLGPGVRAKRSLYQWHRLLGDLFLKHLEKAPAKKHYTAALQHANIDPYRDQCRAQLKLVNALKD